MLLNNELDSSSKHLCINNDLELRSVSGFTLFKQCLAIGGLLLGITRLVANEPQKAHHSLWHQHQRENKIQPLLCCFHPLYNNVGTLFQIFIFIQLSTLKKKKTKERISLRAHTISLCPYITANALLLHNVYYFGVTMFLIDIMQFDIDNRILSSRIFG